MILITGGLGFIGSAYIWYLNQKGIDDIIVYDRFRTADKWKNLRNLRFQDFIPSDRNLEQVEKYSFKSIIHLGACSATTQEDMDFLFQNNYELSKQLWYIAAGEQIPFIYASSAATYGDGEYGFDDRIDLTELSPLNKYGYSKHLFDLWVNRQVKSGQWITPPLFVGLKFFNVFGPNEYHKGFMASMVYHAYQQIKKNGEVKLFKSYRSDFRDGEQKRDFIYVKQVCEQIDRVRIGFNDASFSQPEVASGIYNVGSGKASSFNDLVSWVFKALKMVPKITYIDMPESIRDRYQYFTEAKMERLGLVEALKSESYLEQAVSDYVQRYLERPNRYFDSCSRI